ncbi:MAG: peptide ABC transporter substrate-binding protein [Chlamydiae bacterium]|nr:peptide ABC transporter substrate-binding protein [Chlamydiota bacterium]
MQRFFIVFGITLSFFFCGCQKSTREKGDSFAKIEPKILKINLGSDPHSLDPRKARDLNSIVIMKMCFEGLTRIGKDDKPEFALARSVDISEDHKKYTFHLRKTSWSNGDPVTSLDFVYAWKKALDPKFITDQAFYLYVIKNGKSIKLGEKNSSELGVRALDLLTLEVELENPISYFLELTAFPIFFPVHQKNDEIHPNWAESTNFYISNGPYHVKEWKHQYELIVEKNLLYWDAGSVKLDGIQMVMVREETELKMFEKRLLDWAGSPLSQISLDAINHYKEKGDLQIKPSLGTYFLRTNVEKPPFDHVLMRKAFALAINRKEIVDHITQGNQIVATAFVPPSMKLNVEPSFQDGNVEEARRLFNQALKERGITLQTFPKITLTYVTLERNHLIAQALQQQWLKAFGIYIHLESIEKKVFFDRLSKQDYQLASSNWFADFNDPINFLEVFKYSHSSSNNTSWENPDYVRLLNESAQITDPDLRLKVLSRSQKIIMDQMPIIPIFHFTMVYLQNEKLKDIALSFLGSVDFKWAYFENSK